MRERASERLRNKADKLNVARRSGMNKRLWYNKSSNNYIFNNRPIDFETIYFVSI